MQDGRCGICSRTQKESCTNRKTGVMRKFDMDHDHRTMEVRGLLCRSCNIKLKRGYTLEWLKGAARFLEDPPAKRLLKT